MHITTIILDGFKSYGQRTVISGFDKQFNAITGLNGSGKSNILDAICFVLGISNLSHVRAGSLQDLIYKSGQGGINKATVSITFDNHNEAQCPVGFEDCSEITVTRQIVIGGKQKYMINGANVPYKKVQDLFCSIQLNVNNPHFLIMQGKITKVLNMKPLEILAMVEEAAGTRMYEVKRQAAQKLMDKKDAKLQEINAIFIEETGPKLRKLREEREQFLEYQQVDRELERLLGLYQYSQYFQSKLVLTNAEKNFSNVQNNIKAIQCTIEENNQKMNNLDKQIEEIAKNRETDMSIKLEELEKALKEKVKEQAKGNALIKTVKSNIDSEEKKRKQLELNFTDDSKALQDKEKELGKVQSLFESLKENDARDNEAFALSQKKYEAVCAGMEINDDGEEQTLQEQLMKVKEEAMRANMEIKQASMQLDACQSQLKQKQKELSTHSDDYENDKANLDKKEREVNTLEAKIGRINFSEDRMKELQKQRQVLLNEIRGLREKIDNFQARRPYITFMYTDPESNFNKKSVKGVVARLIKCKDPRTAIGLETAAGGRLYNVVVDTEVTSKKLLQKGHLQMRTTFIPLNKIRANRMDNNIIRRAQQLVGEENCKPALSLIEYDRELQNAMEFIFGNVFICKDINIAKQVTFHDQIRRKCVTLEGDITDPAGTLSGGSQQKGGSVLMQLSEIQQFEEQLILKEKEYRKIEAELQQMSGTQESFNSMKQQLDLARHELNLLKQRLQNTKHHIQQEEINNLKQQISELQNNIKTYRDLEAKNNQKAKELENKMKDSKGYKDRQLKKAEKEMNTCKQKADKSRKEWKQKEQYYETLNLEISELNKGIENIKQQIQTSEEAIRNLRQQFEEMSRNALELDEAVKNLQSEVKKMKDAISEKNKDVQKKNKEKEDLLAENNELQLKVKEQSHEIKKLEDHVKNARNREQGYSGKINTDNPYYKKAESMTHKEGLELESKIKQNQEKKHKLGRIVNTKAQSMFEQEEKQYNDLKKREKIVLADRKRIFDTIVAMDRQKENSLKLAYEQVSKDFGSIFATLLPGANAKLMPPFGKSILQGLEVKVSLGGVWKDSLTELSGGQRSLAALSLILAMLLFKPAPLYILDEVDAALDLSHTQNIGNMLKAHFKKSQFIIVSLKDGMFNNANVLFRTKFVDGVSTISRSVNKER